MPKPSSKVRKPSFAVGQAVIVCDRDSIYNGTPCIVTDFADEAGRTVFARPTKHQTSEVFSKWQLVAA